VTGLHFKVSYEMMGEFCLIKKLEMGCLLCGLIFSLASCSYMTLTKSEW
jgi:hypothetical protein